jgi:hypothetical protein
VIGCIRESGCGVIYRRQGETRITDMGDAIALIYGLFIFGLLFIYVPACEKV